MRRRQFIAGTGLVGAGAVAGLAGCEPAPRAARRDQETPATAPAPRPGDWAAARAQFDLDPTLSHFSAFVLAPHPAPVRDAIERHRRGMDRDAVGYLHANEGRLEAEVRSAAAEYLGAARDELALTDSTTMGLGLLYGGIRLRPDQEVVTTEHDFYATHEALRLRAERTGAAVRRVALYEEAASVTAAEVLGSVRAALRPRTRVLALTWVHSGTGVALPVRRIAGVVARANRHRDEADRVLLCVDGVHGVGALDAGVGDLGCDFLVSGCHKWLFGPRGTGFVWGRGAAWEQVTGTIPSFDGRSIGAWIDGATPETPPGPAMTPGGFHSFEHRWALAEAFRLQATLQRRLVAGRVRELARGLRHGLAAMRHVRLVTPAADELSAGIVCFDVDGRRPGKVVERLLQQRVAASVTPYAQEHVRLGASIVTGPDDVERALRAVRTLA
ncbi:MAG TPA: aminotransferase class V-fold PLP-dependent enzyme [Actinomycetes bacterium]